MASRLSRLRPHDPLNAVLFYAHEVLLPALGWHLSWHLRHLAGLTGATVLTGGLIVAVLCAAVITQDRRCRVFIIAAVATGLVFAAVTSALAWGGPGQRVTVAVEHGARYSTVPNLLLDAALIVAADACARRWWPRPRAIAALAALVVVLAVGWATDFRYPVRHFTGRATDWHLTADRWLRHCQHKPAGTITVTFTNWWGTGQLATTFTCSSLHR